MYIHEEITKAVLPLLEKYDLELIDLIGEMNHAAWELSVLNESGLAPLRDKLAVQNGESRNRLLRALINSREWIGDGRYSDGLSREFWTPAYTQVIDLIDAVIAAENTEKKT